MRVFRYSKNEYKQTYRRLLFSHDVVVKELSLTRIGQDEKTCHMSMIGYPLVPKHFNFDEKSMFKGLLEQVKA
jgi:hypothetical protein